MADYIPASDAEFDKWFHNLLIYVEKHTLDDTPIWMDIDFRHVHELRGAYDEWHEAYERTLVPHTPGVIAAKNEVRDRTVKTVREFVKRYLHFEPRTKEDRVNMALPEHDKTPTPHIDVHEKLLLWLDPSGIRQVSAHFRVEGSESKAKPTGYDGAVLVYAFLDKPPKNVQDLTNHIMASRTPQIFDFDEEDRGKSLYMAGSWQNARGHLGPWSAIEHIHVS